jgi:diguanylate cyclase (GGDEF)-like protein/PAS domain S-box-containing protein
VTSWSRRVSAASQKPLGTQRPNYSKADVLKDAVALGVQADDQAALLALAKVAHERPGFRTTISVQTGDGRPLEFEVVHTDDGPVARQLDEDGAPAPAPTRPATAERGPSDNGADGDAQNRETDEVEILSVLTNTLVETPDLVAVFASVGHEALWANDAFVTLVPIRQADKVWLVELLDEWSKGHYEVKVLPALVKYGRWRGRLTLLSADGDSLPVSAVIVAHRDQRADIAAVSMVARDLTELRLAEERASATETRFAALVEHVSDIIAVLDNDGVIKYASPATARVLGHREGALNGKNLLELIHPEDAPVGLLELARPDEQGVGSPVELRLRSADDAWRYLEIVVSDLTDNPAIGGLVLNGRDVTERVEAAHALAAKAFTDPFTGLPNRMRLLDRLAQGLSDLEEGGSVAVLLLDLDHFKSVNDGYGRPVGDKVLHELANRMRDTVGDEDTPARLRSDEFAVVARDADSAEVVRLANRLREVLSEPVEADGKRVTVTVSIGVAFAQPGHESETLLGEADHALTHAKEGGGDRAEIYGAELADQANRRKAVEQQLRHAIDNDSIIVHYQPIVDVDTDVAVGAEALLRVHDDGGALLSPAEFIDAAESSGLITRLGSIVLQTTCSQLAAWSADGGLPNVEQLYVNISPRQLADPDLPQHVRNALNSAGLPPDRLCLEITESILIGHQATVDAAVSYLRTLGVKIGLDEFGTGQSSLGYLKRFPLDFVKIDRQLIRGLGIDEQDTAIVRATIELAHNLGLVVVAVGVESDEQLEMLQLLQCDRVQGYLFAPPVAPDEFTSRVQAGFG